MGSVSWKWLVLWSLWAARFVRQPTAEVQVESGLLRGSVSNDGLYFYYVGIPYAIVQQRFQAAAPQPKWQGVFEAVDEHIHCIQRWLAVNIVTGQEDCLIINVYTPSDVSLESSIPVMVFIHGGGFISGSSERFMYGPDYIVSKGVILVTFNYRLSVLGCLCLRIKQASGNMGMKDQVAALRWIKRNIKAFGGDPDNVTIFGESAGGASVSYHLISPMSEGLFHKAILQSGSSLSPWAHQYNPVHVASLLVKVFGHDTHNPHEIYKILSSKTLKELVSIKIPKEKGAVFVHEFYLSPCVENEIEGEEAFLTDLPYNLLSSGNCTKVPIIIGSTDQEGYLFTRFEDDEIDFEKSMPKDLVFPTENEKIIAVDKIRNFYMNMGDSSHIMVKISKMDGEPYFTYPVLQESELILKTSVQPIYSYIFNYSGKRNIPKFVAGFHIAFASGAAHADDLFYLFKQSLLPSLFENEMIDRMSTLWSNFAKYGDPTPDNILGFRWETTKAQDPQVLMIGDKVPDTQPFWNSPSVLYWKELYSKYRRMGD